MKKLLVDKICDRVVNLEEFKEEQKRSFNCINIFSNKISFDAKRIN